MRRDDILSFLEAIDSELLRHAGEGETDWSPSRLISLAAGMSWPPSMSLPPFSIPTST
jgi:hypothetical protein